MGVVAESSSAPLWPSHGPGLQFHHPIGHAAWADGSFVPHQHLKSHRLAPPALKQAMSFHVRHLFSSPFYIRGWGLLRPFDVAYYSYGGRSGSHLNLMPIMSWRRDLSASTGHGSLFPSSEVVGADMTEPKCAP